MVVLSRAFLHEHFLFFTDPTTQREHSVNPAHLQAPSVGKQRHQDSLWRENVQSGGNPRTTTPTGYEPKKPATVSRIDAYSGNPYQLYDLQEKCGEEDHRAPITEQVKEFGEIGACVSDSKLSETFYFQSQMHFDDSVERVADSDLEDGELQFLRAISQEFKTQIRTSTYGLRPWPRDRSLIFIVIFILIFINILNIYISIRHQPS